MGWSMLLKADKPIIEADVAACLAKMTKDGNVYDNGWGWSVGVDVSKPKGKELSISGAWYSFDSAQPIGSDIASRLRKAGYKIRVGKPQ